MKKSVIFVLLPAMLLLAACRSETAPTESAPASEQATDASAGEVTSAADAAPSQGSSTVLPPKPAEDLMFVDLERGAKGKAFYRGHPFSGSVWMDFEHTYSCTFDDGVATAYTYYHSGGRVAAVCTPQGRAKQCFDYEGQALTPDSFARRYPDMQRFIDSSF